MDTIEWLRASEYARRAGVHRQWIVRLCQDGRLDGAYKAGQVWLIPSDAAMPKGKPGPQETRNAEYEGGLMERREAARLAALEQAREDRRKAQIAEMRRLGSNAMRKLWPGPWRTWLAEIWAAGGQYDDEGCCTIKGKRNESTDLAHAPDGTREELAEWWARLEDGRGFEV